MKMGSVGLVCRLKKRKRLIVKRGRRSCTRSLIGRKKRREEGFELVKKYIKKFCNYIGITKEEF